MKCTVCSKKRKEEHFLRCDVCNENFCVRACGDVKAHNGVVSTLCHVCLEDPQEIDHRLSQEEYDVVERLNGDVASLLRLLVDIRWASGDCGKRMQDEFVEYIGELKRKADILDRESEESKINLDIAVYLIDEVIQSHGGTQLLEGDNVGKYLSELKLESTKYDDWWENWNRGE